jgi:hypothetical protein
LKLLRTPLSSTSASIEAEGNEKSVGSQPRWLTYKVVK